MQTKHIIINIAFLSLNACRLESEALNGKNTPESTKEKTQKHDEQQIHGTYWETLHKMQPKIVNTHYTSNGVSIDVKTEYKERIGSKKEFLEKMDMLETLAEDIALSDEQGIENFSSNNIYSDIKNGLEIARKAEKEYDYEFLIQYQKTLGALLSANKNLNLHEKVYDLFYPEWKKFDIKITRAKGLRKNEKTSNVVNVFLPGFWWNDIEIFNHKGAGVHYMEFIKTIEQRSRENSTNYIKPVIIEANTYNFNMKVLAKSLCQELEAKIEDRINEDETSIENYTLNLFTTSAGSDIATNMLEHLKSESTFMKNLQSKCILISPPLNGWVVADYVATDMSKYPWQSIIRDNQKISESPWKYIPEEKQAYHSLQYFDARIIPGISALRYKEAQQKIESLQKEDFYIGEKNMVIIATDVSHNKCVWSDIPTSKEYKTEKDRTLYHLFHKSDYAKELNEGFDQVVSLANQICPNIKKTKVLHFDHFIMKGFTPINRYYRACYPRQYKDVFNESAIQQKCTEALRLILQSLDDFEVKLF